jgi:HAD superfamily hydrolase (TIGR01484 family)
VATVSSAASVNWILEGLEINIPVILMNGVVVYDLASREYIKTEIIPEKNTELVIEAFKEHGANGFMYTVHGNELVTYYENLDTLPLQEFYNERVEKYKKYFEKTDNFINNIKENKVIYFSLIGEYEPLNNVLNTVKEIPDIDLVLYTDVYADRQWYLEIFSHNASKRNATRYLRERFCFDKIIGFGDNYNDIPLFEACDEGYAVANAAEKLKEKAFGIIGDNNSDSVARFIHEKVNFSKL